MRYIATAALALFLFPSCATMFSDEVYDLTIWSKPEGASVHVYDEDGAVKYYGTTPLNISVHVREAYFMGKDFDVEFQLEGYAPTNMQVRSSLDWWYFGNILFPILGGLIIDPLTGGMWRYKEDSYGVVLNRTSSEAGHVAGNVE